MINETVPQYNESLSMKLNLCYNELNPEAQTYNTVMYMYLMEF